MRVLITGATGFIGRTLSNEMLKQGFDLTITARKECDFPNNVKKFIIRDLSDQINWIPILKNIDCVIHLAAKAHVTNSNKILTLDNFYKINTKATINLANQAAISNVQRFVFISSIGVNGDKNNNSFTEEDTPNPKEPYAISKLNAELELFEISQESDLEVVVIRPPLVYGANAPGNFGRLMKWANSMSILPLPLGAVKNSRSLISIDNLINFIILCTIHVKAANELFLICDDEDISTTELLKKIKMIFNKKTWLIPIPPDWIIIFAKFIKMEADAKRLFYSLKINNSKAKNLLGWKSIITLDESLMKIANEKNI